MFHYPCIVCTACTACTVHQFRVIDGAFYKNNMPVHINGKLLKLNDGENITIFVNNKGVHGIIVTYNGSLVNIFGNDDKKIKKMINAHIKHFKITLLSFINARFNGKLLHELFHASGDRAHGEMVYLPFDL